MMDPFSPDDISRQDTLTSSSSHNAEVQRKKLLEQSDAVMLLFNPWSKESFEWVNGSVVEDIINTGRKKNLITDIVGILDGLAAAIPDMPRSKSTRSTKLSQKELLRMPSSPAGSGSSASWFDSLDERKGRENEQFDYQGELKRISIVVEGSALKRAEFMIHERDLPSTPLQSPTPKPLVISGPMSLSDRKLPTIREVDSNASLRRGAAMWDNNKRPPASKRRDSAFSFRTTSSAYSQASSTVVETAHGSSVRESNPFTLEDLVDAHMDSVPPEEPPERPPARRATLPPPTEEFEIPVLVVASMTDRLQDNGGKLPRMVSAQQGQELARKFGPNCAYIEVSAKSNANVDEAYGILVDQVMSKRAARQRDEKPSEKAEEIVIVGEEDVMDKDENDRSLPARVVRTKMPRKKSRSCMPAWWDSFVGSVFSWGPSDSEVSAITFEDIGVRPQGEETKEDVWGETVVVKNQNKTSWSSMRKSGLKDNRKSSSTTSTARGDALKEDDLVKVAARPEKTQGPVTPENPFMPEETGRSSNMLEPASVPDKDDKNSRPDEAIFDKLDRKVSKKKARPDSMTLGHEPSKATQPDSSDDGGHKSRRHEAVLDKMSRKIGLGVGPLALDEKPQPQPPLQVAKGLRPLSVDSSLSRSLALGSSNKNQKLDHSQAVFLTNYSHANIMQIDRSKSKSLPSNKTATATMADLDDTSSSIITTATSTVPQRRQHTSLISELPPSIPPLRFDAVRFDGERRFTVMIRLAEQELEQQRARVCKLVLDDAAAAAPVTRSASVGANAGAARKAARARARGVGTNAVGPVKATATATATAAAPVSAVLRAEPARGRKVAGEAAGDEEEKERERGREQAAVVRADQDSRAKALKNRRVVPKGQGQGLGLGHGQSQAPTKPAAPARRATTVRAVLPPTPAPRPRARPNSERRPPGRPTAIWL
ncbi:putative ras-2 protein [Diaporthe ampelina]|uniref:Putative ras-2 protein n=1 Tax=Diaporthe ampelina TaxID=1214573 RepID=A0A0G2F8L1_9PEZI|nr:putative ras-2 protein [Diaporthe ampelina]